VCFSSVTSHCGRFVAGVVCVRFTGLLVERVSQKEEDDAEGDEGRPPGQQEHDDHTNHGAQQRQPLTVEPEGRTPACTHTHTHTRLVSTHSLDPPGMSRLYVCRPAGMVSGAPKTLLSM